MSYVGNSLSMRTVHVCVVPTNKQTKHSPLALKRALAGDVWVCKETETETEIDTYAYV